MQFFATLCAALAVLSPLAHALTTPINARTTGVMQWDGMSNGQNVTLYGHASEIRDQLMAADPNWVPANHMDSSSALAERNIAGPAVCCPVRGQNWSPVSIESIQEAMNHLQQIGGTCTQPANSCALAKGPNGVSACVFGAGIHLCNDSKSTISVSCATIAAYTHTLIGDCRGSGGKTCGQIFDTSSWNVVVSPC